MTERPAVGVSIAVVVGLALLGLLAFDGAAYAWWSTHVTALLSQEVLRFVFAAAGFTHLGEAFYAMHLVRRLGLDEESNKWFLQTLVLGFPSLGILVRRARALQ